MCLENSSSHVGNANLVLNPYSGLVSSQFYVVFDNEFALASALRTITMLSNWADIVSNFTKSVTYEHPHYFKLWF